TAQCPAPSCRVPRGHQAEAARADRRRPAPVSPLRPRPRPAPPHRARRSSHWSPRRCATESRAETSDPLISRCQGIGVVSMSQAAKSERLMNLVICLLVARGYVPKSRIRQVVGGYGGQSDEAFERMFERDKEELREVGIPIETGSFDPFGDEEPGYRIHRQEFELPEIRLEPDEAAVV